MNPFTRLTAEVQGRVFPLEILVLVFLVAWVTADWFGKAAIKTEVSVGKRAKGAA